MAFKGSLWKHWDFLKFWTGDTVTQFTGQITSLALPTIAVLTLQVTALQLGIIDALNFIAFPTLGLFVGVWMDRVRRRPVMIVANLIQVATLASVPLGYVLGVLGLYQLYAVALIMGTSTLFFDVAYQAYLPSLVNKEDVVEGNQKLQTSASAAQVVGPSVASALMQLIGAALSLTVDAFGTLVSVFTLASIRKPEPKPERSSDGQTHFFAEMKEGIRVITGNKLLWTQAGCTSTSNLGGSIFFVAIFLYAYRTLGISKGIIGVAFSISAVGFLMGVLVSSVVTKKLGLGRTIALSAASNFGLLLVLLANRSFAVLIIGAALFVSSLGNPIYNINQVSLRQIITPNRLQGRMNATMRTIVWGTIPAGSFLGGIFSTSFGIIPTLVIGSVISGASFLWIALGPTFKLKEQPKPAND
ncbi:MAG TPA: MFS transporter [Candidatus Acidoferrales bacterium]|nr:MFS transporter [Candidatus Acidoferrales bacterium]